MRLLIETGETRVANLLCMRHLCTAFATTHSDLGFTWYIHCSRHVHMARIDERGIVAFALVCHMENCKKPRTPCVKGAARHVILTT